MDILKSLHDPDIRQRLCILILEDKTCRTLIINALIEELNQANNEKAAAKNWFKLISFCLTLITLSMSNIIHIIFERVKEWMQ